MPRGSYESMMIASRPRIEGEMAPISPNGGLRLLLLDNVQPRLKIVVTSRDMRPSDRSFISSFVHEQ